jgi:ligand-binding sensor domain-containing protein/signal transduction histidine kinase/DNA-binding response OmpR family regulator
VIPTIAVLKKKITAILFSLSGFLPALHAQQYYFKHYSVESGLSNNSVGCSLQDKNGFLWFGTINGLNRFDGYSFKIFRHDPEDSISIGSNFIRCLYEDHEGCIWAGTNRGIYVYNTHTEKFSRFPKTDLVEVSDIKEDKQGRLWMISNSNLFRYDPLSREIKGYNLDSIPGTASSIAIATDGTIWVSTNSAMLKKYLPTLDSFETYSVLHVSGKKPALRIEKIYSLRNGNLLIGTLTRGVKLFDPSKKTFHDIVSLNPDKSDVYIRDFMQMTENKYWIGTETGIYIYDARDGTIKRLKKEYDNPYSVSDNVILTFCKDREGGLWIGTYFGGLNYYPNPFTTFQKYFPAYDRPSISGNAVHEICKDKLGNLWVGTEDAGLNKIDLQKNTFTSYKPTGSKTSIAYHNVHGLLVTGDSLWIGTFMHGLDIMNIRTGKVIRHYNAGPAAGDLKNNFIITLYQTRNGDILVGTQNGLFKYNRPTNNFSLVPHFTSQIQTLWEDEQGTLWACTRGNGVLFENPFTKQSGSLLYNPHDSNSLGNNYVNGVYEDGKSNLWFATDGGLCHFEKDKNRFTRYTTKNGLPDNLILRILEDENHDLFLSTSKGLVCFNPGNGNIRTYTKSNGLLNDQFNYNSAYKDVDGRMFFGSVKGLISFKPDEFIKNTDIPPVYITGLEVNNQDIVANKPGSLLKESIIYTKNISLPYDQSTLSIDFAALSYTVPEMNEYAYKMVGLDKDWTVLKRNRKVYYTKMPPGNYQFKVRGSNSSGIWNTKEASIEIFISPPFWASVWAYMLYVACTLVLAYVLIKSYLNRVDEKHRRKFEILDMEKEREIYHSKIEFFTNIAHEIRTPLTLIKMPLDKMMKKKTSDAEIHYNLKTMEKNTNRLIDLTNQLLDFRNTEMDKFRLNFIKTDISDLIRETYSSFQLAAEEKNIDCKLELPGIALQAYVDPEALKKILSNLFNNAIKYAESRVVIRLKNFNSEDKLFTIVISNDGFIIPYDFKEKIFEPFYRIKETDRQPGNGIGLPLSRSLAELHKGVLDLSKSENDMNVFVLTLPIQQENGFKMHTEEPAVPTEVVVQTEEEVILDSSKPEILLVEDNNEILEFICKEISSEYLVHKAHNGAEALELIKEGNIQLVISDIMMPVMDGLELCKRMKTNLEYSHIPLILLTAKNSLHARIEGLETGADAYIEKPFDFDHLYAQMSNLLVNRNKIKDHFANSPFTHIKSIGYTKADKNFLEKLKQVIDENLTNIDIDVEHLAKIMNMSRPTFYRKIKALSNLTPRELIQITRLKKAAELLSSENYRVYEVAGMVGYSLQTNFARDFHKQFGMTPTEYMNELHAKLTPGSQRR